MLIQMAIKRISQLHPSHPESLTAGFDTALMSPTDTASHLPVPVAVLASAKRFPPRAQASALYNGMRQLGIIRIQ